MSLRSTPSAGSTVQTPTTRYGISSRTATPAQATRQAAALTAAGAAAHGARYVRAPCPYTYIIFLGLPHRMWSASAIVVHFVSVRIALWSAQTDLVLLPGLHIPNAAFRSSCGVPARRRIKTEARTKMWRRGLRVYSTYGKPGREIRRLAVFVEAPSVGKTLISVIRCRSITAFSPNRIGEYDTSYRIYCSTNWCTIHVGSGTTHCNSAWTEKRQERDWVRCPATTRHAISIRRPLLDVGGCE